MKNTMKKLLSLVLVAMLLVCAVPFQAAATEADETLTVKTYVDGKYVTDKYVTVKPGQENNIRICDVVMYVCRKFHSGHARHLNICDNQVEVLFIQQCHCFHTIFRTCGGDPLVMY